jgi:hypothetical protein
MPKKRPRPPADRSHFTIRQKNAGMHNCVRRHSVLAWGNWKSSRVARWYNIFGPKKLFWVFFWWPLNDKGSYLEYFMAIWYMYIFYSHLLIFWPFGRFSAVLVYCTMKSLATPENREIASNPISSKLGNRTCGRLLALRKTLRAHLYKCWDSDFFSPLFIKSIFCLRKQLFVFYVSTSVLRTDLAGTWYNHAIDLKHVALGLPR